jgi:hypothetical protein
MKFQDKMRKAQSGWRMDAAAFYEDHLPALKSGRVIFDLRDSRTGEQLAYWEDDNIIVLDAGILMATLATNSLLPNPSEHNGISMLAIGTGATGNLLSPDAPQATQRKLNNEIERKAFSNTQFRDSGGAASSIQTNIVDYTTVFSEGEAVGPLNEMALMAPFSSNPTIKNPINNGPTGYDPLIDVSALDIIVNYISFSVVSKPSTAVLALTWRLTF